MIIGDRDRLLRRIRQVRKANAAGDESLSDQREAPPDRLAALEARVAHLEQLLEGFQDSVHRETARHANLIAELQNQVEPGAMGAALAEHARNRGL